MIRHFLDNGGTRLIAGFGTGLAACAMLVAWVLHGAGAFVGAGPTSWEKKLYAASAHTGENMTIATGPIEAGLDGIFVLDGLTGDLTCGVINPRSGAIAGHFRRNIAADLGVVAGKLPKYLMVTGYIDVKGTIGNTRPALSLVYIADANTGRYAGYMLPWNSQALNQNLPQVQTLVPIGAGSARNVAIE